jgi:signal transduction histidine kinase
MQRIGFRRSFLGRRSVRARIALACAGLFFITGSVFVGASYALADHSFAAGSAARRAADQAATGRVKQSPGANQAQNEAQLAQICTKEELSGQVTDAEAAQCNAVFAGGAAFGATNQRDHDLHQLLLWSLAGLVAGTIVAGGLGWAIGRRILAPLHRVTDAARRASQEHLDERINLDGPHDELKELADTFDDMLNRLDLAFASQRRFVANASHELRTPLTSMRTLIDVAMAKSTRTTEGLETLVGRVREAVDESEAIIGGLLTLARSDRGLTVRELVDLEAAALDAIDQTSSAARDWGIVVESDLSAAPIRGDRVLVERLVANLVDNAIRYNFDGGSVHVETGVDHGESYLSIANSGPLVQDSKLASLFEPFTRLEQRLANGQGIGLGLSIVASVAAAHDGHLEAAALPDGGLKITVRFRALAEPSQVAAVHG